MATNPMQRKARNSFILGMLVMLVICGVIIAFLFIQITNLNKKEQENKQASVKVYVLSQDVGSGQVITTDMFTMQTVNKSLVPLEVMQHLFETRIVILEELYYRIETKDEKYYVQIFDDNITEEKFEVKSIGNIKTNKKLKIFI